MIMFTAINSLRWLKITIGAIALCALLSACATAVAPPTSGVTFSVPVPVAEFGQKGTLQVLVWNADQIAALDRQVGCVIAHDAQTGTDTTLCPEGVQYQEITPEKFNFPLQTINQNITWTSRTVKVSEKYRVALRGLSKDECNATSATAEGTATSSTITLGNLDWLTTEMACVQPQP